MAELNSGMQKDIENDFESLVRKKELGLGKNYGDINHMTESIVDKYDGNPLASIVEKKLLSKSEHERYCAANILALLGLRLIYHMDEKERDDPNLINEIFDNLEKLLAEEKDPFVKNILQYYLLIKNSRNS